MSIRSKLTLALLAVALVPLFFVSYLTFDRYRNSLQAMRLAELQDVASFKTDKIEAYLASLRTQMEIAQGLYNIKKNLPLLIRASGDPSGEEFLASKNMLDGQLKEMQSILDLSDIMLLDPGGNIVYSTNSQHDRKDFMKPVPGLKTWTHWEGEISISDVFFNEREHERPAILIRAPVHDDQGRLVGVVVFEVDMASVYRLIEDRTGMGSTGETVVGKKIGRQIVYLAPLRHDPSAVLKKMINIGGSFGGPMQRAVQGENGSGRMIDYRGQEVVAAWRYIPSLGWGVVSKIDSREAFAEAMRLRDFSILILVIVFGIGGLTAFYLARSISRPIKELSRSVRIVGNGNLDYKLSTQRKDEIGDLSRAFDKMTHDLKKAAASRDAERQRLYNVLESLPVYVVLLAEDYRVPFANKFFVERFGESGGARCFEYLFHRNEPCDNCETYKVMKTHAPHHWHWTGPDNRNYDIYDFPFTDSDGSKMILEMGIDITEQTKAEVNLRQAYAYNRTLIEASPDPLVTIGPDGKITDVNEATVKATGLLREALIGTDFSGYFTDPQMARAGYQQVFEQGFVTDYPLTLRHKSGKIMDVLYNATVYRDTHGRVLGVFAAARDVTLLKQASQYARSLLEASLDPLVTISSDGKITDVNEAAIKATGMPRKDLIGSDFSGYFTDPQMARAGYQQVFEQGFVTDYPLTLRHKDGRLMDVLYNATIYRDTHGRVLGVFAAARDVTLLKQAEAELRKHRDNLEQLVRERTAELRENEDRLSQALEAGEFGSWGLDVRTGKAWRTLRHDLIFGYESLLPEWTYAMFLGHVLPEDRKAVDQKFGRSLAAKTEWDFECRIRRKDGAIRWIWAQGKPRTNEQNETTQLVGLVQDITARKRFEEELRRSNENLEQFAYVASHDLQEPLRMMASYAELLERRYKQKLDSDADEFIGYIVDGAQRMQKLINDLLAYSRIGRSDKPPEEIDCNELFKKVTRGLKTAIEESGALITHDALPQVTVNESYLFQIFQNLIGNAIKFRGQEPPRVHVGVLQQEGAWRFSVKDNGIGIEPQYKDRIFLIFQRLHGRDKYPGTGIGLSICKKIVEMLGGRIWVESAPGKGTTFNFTIPDKGGMKNGQHE